LKVGNLKMRKILPVVSIVCGILTFVFIALACRSGSVFTTAMAAVLCTMAVIASDVADGNRCDADETDL